MNELQLLKALASEASGSEETKMATKMLPNKARNRAEDLKELFDIFNQETNFSVGELVQWKQGMKTKKRPQYGEPCIIVEMLDSPVFSSEKNAGSAYFREPMDMVVGLVDSDDDFVIFHFDSRRFEKFES